MHATRIRTLTATALAAAVVLPAAGAAHAATSSRSDPTRDVVSSHVDGGAVTTARRDASTDITRFTVSHSTQAVVTTMTLRRFDSRFFWATVHVVTDTSDGDRYRVDYERHRMDDGDIYTNFALVDPMSTPVACSGLAKRFDRGPGGTIRFTVPRACLGDPAWVQVAGAMITFPTSHTVHMDLSHQRGDGTYDTLPTMPLSGQVPVG